jgi:four helix bundle protein
MIQRFEDLHIWQLAREMVVEVYKIFESNRDYDFKNQIQRASISVMNNIAEGFEKDKLPKTINSLLII